MNQTTNSVEALYHAHQRPLTAYVRRRVRREDADDIVQETFLHFWRHGDVSGLAHPRSYLYRVAANLIVDLYRRRRRGDQNIVDDVDVEAMSSTAPDHRRVADSMMQVSLVQVHLGDLPPRCRTVYLMHQLDGWTYQEIADRLKVSLRTVNREMFDASAKLGVVARP
jgi:RNA polymerase sigma-70 factor (ECF subfamily)